MRVRADLRRPLSLRNVLPDAEFIGAQDIALTACSSDARRVRPGTVLVIQHRGHGHAQAAVTEAISRGCSGIVAEPAVLAMGELSGPICCVPHAGEAFGQICQAIAGSPSRQLKVVGLAGASDMTAASCLISGVLTAAGNKIGIMGSLGCFDGQEVAHYPQVTPPAPLVARWLGRMVQRGCSHAVMEISRRALRQRWVGGVSFDAVCLTGLEGLCPPEFDAAVGQSPAASRVLERLTPEGFAVVNADDPHALDCLRMHDGPVLTIGMQSEAEITATIVERCPSEQTILLCAGSEAIPVRTRMVGIRHVYDCLAASAVGLAYGIDLPTVVRGLEAIDYVPGRLERIECGQPFGVFVDRARSPEALQACLETLREVVQGRLICVTGARGERNADKRPKLGRVAEANADLVVITDDDPRSEDPQVILEDILSGLTRPDEAEVIPDRAEAIGWALSQARAGDCVLIAGRGHCTRQVIGSQRRHFDDREVARQWLYANPCDHE